MKKSSSITSSRKGKHFVVVRNFNGTLTAEQYVAELLKEYINKVNRQP